MLRTQKSTFLNSDFFAKSEIQNIITISKIMKLVQKLNSQQQIEHGGPFLLSPWLLKATQMVTFFFFDFFFFVGHCPPNSGV